MLPNKIWHIREQAALGSLHSLLLKALAPIGKIMNFEEMSEDEIINIANPIMDNLMTASTNIDHASHIKDFTERMKDIVTEDYLQFVCEQYQEEKGYFADRELVAVFKRPESAVIVWKQLFTKAKGEFVAEMVLVHHNDRYLCDHAAVF